MIRKLALLRAPHAYAVRRQGSHKCPPAKLKHWGIGDWAMSGMKTFGSILAASVATVAFAHQAFAGGLERGGYNIDLLFDPGKAVAGATYVFVMPDRELYNVRDTNPADGLGSDGVGGGATTVRNSESYWLPQVGLKFIPFEPVDCLIDYSQPWGAHSNPGADWVGANSNIETRIYSDNYAATCSYRWDAGPGALRFIGGVFYQVVGGSKKQLVANVQTFTGGALNDSGIGGINLQGSGYGWRIGAAYEIPEIAFRASLVYNSAVKLDEITGEMDLTQVPSIINPANPYLGRVTDIFGSGTMPQSVELKLQSGIAPGWLAFGSVKWVDWSVLQTVSFCPTAIKSLGVSDCTYNGGYRLTSLDLLYRDGWTISGGIGHQFTETLGMSAYVGWDRGTSTGIGTETDTWIIGGGAAWTPNDNVELRLGAAIGIMEGGSSGVVVDDEGNLFGTDISYDFGDDLISAISFGLKVKF